MFSHRTDIEGSLERLDSLKPVAAQMSAAQVLKAAVNDRVKDVGDQVNAVDDKLVAVIDGVQCIFNQLSNVSNS